MDGVVSTDRTLQNSIRRKELLKLQKKKRNKKKGKEWILYSLIWCKFTIRKFKDMNRDRRCLVAFQILPPFTFDSYILKTQIFTNDSYIY